VGGEAEANEISFLHAIAARIAAEAVVRYVHLAIIDPDPAKQKGKRIGSPSAEIDRDWTAPALPPFAVEAEKENRMILDRRRFLLLGGTGLVALGTTKMTTAEMPTLLRGEDFSPASAKHAFARAFNLWMDQATRCEHEWSHEADDAALFRKQLRLGIRPSHGAGATAHLLEHLELGESRLLPLGTTRVGAKAVAPAEEVFARAFNLWMYDTVQHPQRWSHEAHDVLTFRKQAALGIEPRYGIRASANLMQFLEQAQLAS
jgi:hypothetical protein